MIAKLHVKFTTPSPFDIRQEPRGRSCYELLSYGLQGGGICLVGTARILHGTYNIMGFLEGVQEYSGDATRSACRAQRLVRDGILPTAGELATQGGNYILLWLQDA